jgi:uncharacterized protein (DUF952 family)
VDGAAGTDRAWVYKILRAHEWRVFRDAGVFEGSPADLKDGFIHLSAATQVAGTREKHFAGESDLVLLRISAAALGHDLRWEPSRGGALFPHLYRSLRLDEVEVCTGP